MENKKIRFPIATIFVIFNCFFSAVNLILVFNSLTDKSYWASLIPSILNLVTLIILFFFLLIKDQSKTLSVIMWLLITPKIGSFIGLIGTTINLGYNLDTFSVILNLLYTLPLIIGIVLLYKLNLKPYYLASKTGEDNYSETTSTNYNKIKFPITIIFIIIECFIILLQIYSTKDLRSEAICLNIAPLIAYSFLCYFLLTKKNDKVFFITFCLLFASSIGGVLQTIFVNPTKFDYDVLNAIKDIFVSILGTGIYIVQYLLLYKWFKDPYEKEKIVDENYNNTLDYNESYIDLVKHILLSLFTFGIWMLIWIYKTTNSLNKAPNTEKYDPTKKLLLCMFVPFYMIYWYYKHAEKIDKLNAVAEKKSDNTTMYLLLAIFIPIVACILMQDNINKLCTSDVCVTQASNSETSVNTTVKDEKNTAEALKDYKSLLDMGVITQEEFDAKKKQLLGM